MNTIFLHIEPGEVFRYDCVDWTKLTETSAKCLCCINNIVHINPHTPVKKLLGQPSKDYTETECP